MSRFVGPSLPTTQDRLIPALYDNFRRIAAHLAGLSKGWTGYHDAYTAAPTAGDWQQGDFVRNSAPVEAGSASSKYVITGWICTASGTPGTWLECRTLTGN